MTAMITVLLLTAVLLAPFDAVAAPLVGRLYDDGYDADARRVEHDLDAVRTRFEDHPVWPSPGVIGERR
jgi:hypothetical protein